MSKYIRIYESLCPADRIAMRDPRRADIIAEMRAIHCAGTDAEASKAIAWWDVWPNERHATAEEFCREARNMLNQEHRMIDPDNTQGGSHPASRA